MGTEINFPVRYLMGLAHLIDKTETREYLTGVWLSNGKMYAANSWGVGRLFWPGLKTCHDEFIPIEIIKQIAKEYKKVSKSELFIKVAPKEIDKGCTLSLGTRHWCLEIMQVRPDFDRSIPHPAHGVTAAQFDWDKLAIFNRVAETIDDNTTSKAYIYQTGKDTPARVEIKTVRDFTGAIMPLKT